MRKLLVFILFFGLLSGPVSAAVGLSGGQFEVVKDGSVLTEFQNLEDAVWAASVLEADVVQMVAIRVDTSDVTFEVWKDGSIVATFPTKSEALTYAKDNGADSIAMPPQTVNN